MLLKAVQFSLPITQYLPKYKNRGEDRATQAIG